MRPRLAVPLAFLAALGAGAALAAGVTERTRTAVVPSFDSNHATARCGASQGLALGGFRAETRRSKGLVVNRFRPAGSRAFSVGATNVFINDADISATAYCARPRQLKLVTGSVNIAGQSGGHTEAGGVGVLCPAGMSVRLGGFEADVSPQPSGPALVVDGLKRTGRGGGLVVSATNGGTQKGRLTAFAECGSGPKLTAVRKTVAMPDDGGRKAVTARCRHRGRLVFGGFATSTYDGNGPYISQLRRMAPGRWRAGAFQFPQSGGRLTAIAYCS